MEFKIGDLVRVDDTDDTFGVIVSSPVETPAGFTVRVAFDNKILSMYTWCIAPVKNADSANKHSKVACYTL